MSKAGRLTIDPSPTLTLTPTLLGYFSAAVVRPLVLPLTTALKQSIASFFLTCWLPVTAGDFVRLTNRSPSPPLMSFEHFIAIWPAVLEPQREWSMMETPYKKKINQTHFNSNAAREREREDSVEDERCKGQHVWHRGEAEGEHRLWVFMAEKTTHHFIFHPLW